jgi:hypothetical protein
MPVLKNKILSWVKVNKQLLKYVGLGIIGLIVMYYMILLLTPKPQIPTNIKVTLDSLTNANKQLLENQKQIDSTIAVYKIKVNEVDFQIDNIKEKTTIVREYYHEVGQQVDKFTPSQIDSFFKIRYNY